MDKVLGSGSGVSLVGLTVAITSGGDAGLGAAGEFTSSVLASQENLWRKPGISTKGCDFRGLNGRGLIDVGLKSGTSPNPWLALGIGADEEVSFATPSALSSSGLSGMASSALSSERP
jgi:hypothetical protein